MPSRAAAGMPVVFSKRKSNKPYVRWKIKLSASILYKRVDGGQTACQSPAPPPAPPASPAFLPPAAGRSLAAGRTAGGKERESGERSLISQSGQPPEAETVKPPSPTLSARHVTTARRAFPTQSDDIYKVPTRAESPPHAPFTLGLFFEPTNKQITALFDDSMLPKVIAEQRDHCYLPTLGYQKTAKLQLPPPNSLLPYNSYYIIYIQFPVRSGFVVGQIHE